jgi:prepilin-type N-terminal cleavage/methylation domain-containing protein
MKTTSPYSHRNTTAFTLIELLVVILIIGLLAGMIVTIGPAVMAKTKIKRCQSELQTVELAIKNYKEKKGFYPPDNPNDPAQPPLFYELVGTIYVPGNNPPATAVFNAKQGNFSLTAAQISTAFNIGGFVNSTQDPVENPLAVSVTFSQGQFATNSSGINFLICPVDGPNMLVSGGIKLNTWHYVSGSPTNNPNSFDLWADVIVRGKTNRICNWSTAPIIQ